MTDIVEVGGAGPLLAASYTDGSGSAAGRIALVAVAVLAVGAYAFLQLKAQSRRAKAGRLRYDPWDWRTYPPESRPAGPDAGVPYGNEESSRPDWRYGYPPGYEPYPLYEQARSPWAVRDDAASQRRSLAVVRRPSQARLTLPNVFVSVTGKRVDWQRLVVLAANTGGASRC